MAAIAPTQTPSPASSKFISKRKKIRPLNFKKTMRKTQPFKRLAVLAAGYCAIAAAARARSLTAIAVLMVGWPLVLWWTLRGTVGVTATGTWVVLLLAEGLLVLLAASVRDRSGQRASAVLEEASA